MDRTKTLRIVMRETVRKITFSATIDAVYQPIKLVWMAQMCHRNVVMIISDVQVVTALS